MSIFISLGIYSQKGADGIINGDSDRKAAMEKMISISGSDELTASSASFAILRYSSTLPSFTRILAIKIKGLDIY